MQEKHPKRAWAEIDLSALKHNVSLVRQLVGPSTAIMAIVKADAYHHGANEVAQTLKDDVQMFGVANITEAQRLNEALGCDCASRIFILGPALPDERPAIIRDGFVPCISDYEEAAAYNDLVQAGKFSVHLVVDTGMGRIGVWCEEAIPFYKKLRGLKNLSIDGIKSHLPSADEDEAFTGGQLERFARLIDELRAEGCDAPVVHSLNSAGIIRFHEHADGMVRAGLMMYGYSPVPEFQQELRPVMTLKTRVTLVREVGPGRSISYGRTFVTQRQTRVATLAIGYADGFHRTLSGRGAAVLIAGKRCPLLGRVTMDQILVDVSAAGDVKPGDEAVLIGKQGHEQILATELAEKSGTIIWEILTSIGSRVERFYL